MSELHGHAIVARFGRIVTLSILAALYLALTDTLLFTALMAVFAHLLSFPGGANIA